MDDKPINAVSLGKQLYKGKVFGRILLVAILGVVAFMFGIFGASALVTQYGEYTVSILDGVESASISLSETSDFASPTVRLTCPGIPSMTNISENDLPSGIDDLDGSHNGDSYIAYTFYIRNVGTASINLQEEMLIDSSVLGADSAMRVKVYKNGTPTTYAKLGAEGVPEYGTTPFLENKVFSTVTEGMTAGQTIKYTFVIWLEGDDPECLDNIRGGAVKLSMQFSVIEPSSE